MACWLRPHARSICGVENWAIWAAHRVRCSHGFGLRCQAMLPGRISSYHLRDQISKAIWPFRLKSVKVEEPNIVALGSEWSNFARFGLPRIYGQPKLFMAEHCSKIGQGIEPRTGCGNMWEGVSHIHSIFIRRRLIERWHCCDGVVTLQPSRHVRQCWIGQPFTETLSSTNLPKLGSLDTPHHPEYDAEGRRPSLFSRQRNKGEAASLLWNVS